MEKRIIYCSCGLWHDIDELLTFKKFGEGEIPDAIECSECPICNDEDLDDDENGDEIVEEE